ncbi:MAG: CAP domain-containing protein [Actinomycetota bacterium]
MGIRQLVVALLLATVVLTPGQPNAAEAAEMTTGQAEATFHSLINGTRAAHGLAPLAVDGQLVGQARSWSQTMAGDGVLRHAGDLSGGISANWEVLGENVGTHDVIDINRLYQAFVASPAHLANIVDPRYDRMGVGVVFDGQGRVWTTHRFMAVRGQEPAPTTVAPTTTAPPTTTTTRPPTTTTTRPPATTRPPTTRTPTTAPPTTRPPTPPTTVASARPPTTATPTTARPTTTRAPAPSAALVPLVTTTIPASVFSAPPPTVTTTANATAPEPTAPPAAAPAAADAGTGSTAAGPIPSTTTAGDGAIVDRPTADPSSAPLPSTGPPSTPWSALDEPSDPTEDDGATPDRVPHSPRERYAVEVDGRHRPIPTFYSFLIAWWLGTAPGLDGDLDTDQGSGPETATGEVEVGDVRSLLEQLQG